LEDLMPNAQSSLRRFALRSSLAGIATVVALACARGDAGGSGGAFGSGSTGGFGSSTSGPSFGEGGSFGGLDATTGTAGGPCAGNGWNCKIDPCEGGPKTTVTAKVYDPAGKVPLYNVAVYVPNDDLAPIATGPSCDNCATPVSGSPLVSTLTDPSGQFVLSDVPVGTNVPLVLQIGKWRREITLPQVNACQDNPFDDPALFRLPRTQSEGNLPKIALAVGGADTLECLLRRIGVADAEFTDPSATGRVNLFVDDIFGTASVDTPTTTYTGGGAFPPFSSLFTGINAVDDGGFVDAGSDPLSSYDIVITSCQGSQSAGRAITSADKQALKAFVDSGGRAFLSHYNYGWLRGGDVEGSKDIVASPEGSAIDLQTKYTQTPFPPIAVWEDPTALTYAPGGDGTYTVDQTFPRGSDMAKWLLDVGASTTLGQIALANVKNPATSVLSGVAQRWIYDDAMGTPYISANTPIELAASPDQQCGRIVHTGIHVSATASDSHSSFPGGCETGDLTGQEKALEFLFFDLSSCVTDETKPPPPPPR
jgi:hypothetical protein